MSYRIAPSLDDLRDEVNAEWPNRDKASDGWIGDPSHQARVSDHNPDYADGGIVRALDIDKDGINVDRVLNAVCHDSRTSYVIWNYRIWGGSRWRKYEGRNKHTKHVHVSIKHTSAAAKRGDWGIHKGKPAVHKPSKVKPQTTKHRPTGSTNFPTDYEDLAVKGLYDDLRQGAIQILMRQLGYTYNKQWDGDIASRTYTDMQNWLQDVGYYEKTPVTKWGVRKGTPLKVDGHDGAWFWYEFQRYLQDRKFYRGVLDGDPKSMTFTAIERWLNDNNGL